MKCEKCGNNEANFHYESNVNGERTEYNLCTECAKAEGFGQMFNWSPRSMFNSFWSDPFESMFGGNPFGGFFSEPFGGFGRLMAPVMALPRVNIVIGDPGRSTEISGENTDNIPEDAGEEVKAKRELSSLKHQLKAAIKAEEFEKAAELRDKIREMEK